MDIYDVTQIALVVSAGLVLARVGLALARRIERGPECDSRMNAVTEDRLKALEEESSIVRHELVELHERQDFAERMLQSKPERARSVSGASMDPVVTPH
jgi:hypothetical protein